MPSQILPRPFRPGTRHAGLNTKLLLKRASAYAFRREFLSRCFARLAFLPFFSAYSTARSHASLVSPPLRLPADFLSFCPPAFLAPSPRLPPAAVPFLSPKRPFLQKIPHISARPRSLEARPSTPSARNFPKLPGGRASRSVAGLRGKHYSETRR